MFILSINMWFQDLMRTFFFNIDKIVFNFISTVYDLLITIARTSILSQADILDMADRIYKLLAVFMVFKVTFSLIMYVVNPDDFSDKSKGVSKLGMNIVFSLAMLILTPYIFNYAYQFQTIILEDNSLGTLIFGEDAQNAAESPFNTAGDTMAFITLTPFFTPNLSLDGLEACSTLTVEGEDANGNKIFNEECENELGKEGYLDDDTRLGNYVAGVEHSNLGLMFRLNLAVATDKNENNFIMEYRYIFSTVVGVVVVLLLITFCMDVAVRSIKLAFLQLIAPIPILSYVDPKSGKDGMFKKWYQMCFKTYISLFIRLLALYFAVYIISRIDKMVDIVDGSYVTNSFIKIFIIIGALMFAKQLPKMLEGLGIKLDGGFTLNPIKKFNDQALGGKRITGAVGGMVGGMADRGARIFTAPGFSGKMKSLAGTVPALFGSAARGFGSNGGFSGGLSRQSQVNRRLREGRINGLSATASYFDYIGSKFGLDDATLEKESTLIRKNKDNIREAEQAIEDANRKRNLGIEQRKKEQATRKNTQANFGEVKKQAGRLLDSAEDFLVKKGDFDMGAHHEAQMNALDARVARFRSLGTTQVAVGHDAQGNAIFGTVDEYYARESRKINEKNYKFNRNADAANVKHLEDHNGETLTSTFMIGDQIFKAGTQIDGNVIAAAKAAQGAYIKESQKAVTNKMSEMSKNPNNLTGEDLDFYNNNSSDFDSFKNINEEFNEAVEHANESVTAYNAEYNVSIDEIDTSVGATFYDMIKTVKGDMESGASITEINTQLAKSKAEDEKAARENEEVIKNTKVTYYDKSGRKQEGYDLDKAKSEIKPREENNKYKKEQHNQRRSMMEAISNSRK